LIIPAVMFIEMAMDALKERAPGFVASEAKEFSALGPARKAEIVAHCGGDDMAAGYLLGLETIRVLLATNVKAVQAGVSL
jgi:hypothetical protein